MAVSCAVAAAALAGCGSDDGGSGDDDAASDSIACHEGTVGPADVTAESDVRITHYDAHLTIAANGDLTGQETITVEFDDSEHHGIYRKFSDLVISDATGTLDGAPSGSFTDGRLTLGDADATLAAGEHSFGVSYTAPAALEPPTDVAQDQQFDAAVINADWALDIADAEVTIVLPADDGDVSCIAGPGATASISGAGTTTLVVTAEDVPAGSGVRVLVGVDASE